MEKKHIIIVEDEPSILENLVSLLEFEGHEVVPAQNGKVALDILAQTPTLPDCILLDLMMPICSGRDFLEIFSKDQRLSRIPVVLTSASFEANKTVKEYRTHFVAKPMDVDVLLDTIQEAMNGSARPSATLQ